MSTMSLFQHFAQSTFQNISAWIDQRSRPRPAQLGTNPRLPNIVINHDALEHHWSEPMNDHERRAWNSYWQLPGRDYQQVDMAAAAPDWDPDIDEDFNHVADEDAGVQLNVAVVVAGEPVQGEDRAEDELQADEVRQGRALQEVHPAANAERPGFDDEADRNSGYSTASSSSSPKQEPSTSALSRFETLQQAGSSDSIDPLHPNQPTNKLLADTAIGGGDASTIPGAFDQSHTVFSAFKPSNTTPSSSPTQDNVDPSSDHPLFRANGLGSLGNDSTTESASQNNTMWPRGGRSVMQRGVLMDATLSDGLVRRGRDASYPNHKWMGPSA